MSNTRARSLSLSLLLCHESCRVRQYQAMIRLKSLVIGKVWQIFFGKLVSGQSSTVYNFSCSLPSSLSLWWYSHHPTNISMFYFSGSMCMKSSRVTIFSLKLLEKRDIITIIKECCYYILPQLPALSVLTIPRNTRAEGIESSGGSNGCYWIKNTHTLIRMYCC